MYEFFLGIDHAVDTMWICCLNGTGDTLWSRKIGQSGADLHTLGDELINLAAGRLDTVAIGIETIDAPIVDHLIGLGLHLYSLKPQASHELRKRKRPSGAKSDALDAWVIARGLWNPDDRASYRRMELLPASAIHLRHLGRLDDIILSAFTRTCQQLSDAVRRFYIQILDLCPAVDRPWIWELLRMAPTPDEARALTVDHIAPLLIKFRIRKLSAEDVIRILHAPAQPVAPGIARAYRVAVLSYVNMCQLLREERRAVQQDIDAALQAYDADQDGAASILQSWPGLGPGCAAKLLGEGHPALHDVDALMIWSGVKPMTKGSGQSRSIRMRRACSSRLRDALYHIANCSMIRLPWARERYHAARARGKKHAPALRILGAQILRRLVAMLRNHSPFDPDRLASASPPGSPG